LVHYIITYKKEGEKRKERNMGRRELKNRRGRRKEPANVLISDSKTWN
jgi:hypothetical protein